jgi:hypothetical protein
MPFQLNNCPAGWNEDQIGSIQPAGQFCATPTPALITDGTLFSYLEGLQRIIK